MDYVFSLTLLSHSIETMYFIIDKKRKILCVTSVAVISVLSSDTDVGGSL